MKKDDIKTFITILIVCSLIVGLVLILNRKSNSDKLVAVNDYNSFFATTNYVNSFLSYSSDASRLYDLLDSSYIDRYGITTSNIFDYVDSYRDTSIMVTSMEYVNIRDNFIYYVRGRLVKNSFDSTTTIQDNFEIVVLVDNDNSSYSVIPVSGDYSDIINGIKRVKVISNRNNGIKRDSSIKKEQVCVIYMSDYIYRLFNDISSAYDVLSDNMKKKYVSLDSFSRYVNSNVNDITTAASKCSLETVKKKRVYTVLDEYNNRYVFTENSVMDYSVSFYLSDNSE